MFGIGRSRWRLADLRSVVPALGSYTEGGVSLALKRLGVSRQRGRLAVHSPDPAYEAKLTLVRWALSLALEGEATVLYGDEFGFYRHPTLAPKYALRGDEPLARLSCHSNIRHRMAGALDVRTGRVSYLGHNKIGVVDLRRFLKLLRRVYKQGRLILIWDNWPIHLHEEILSVASELQIELLWLPTYAPWTNPIEKLWRWCRQEVLHHHTLAENWRGLKDKVRAWLDQFDRPSPELLRYVGLLHD